MRDGFTAFYWIFYCHFESIIRVSTYDRCYCSRVIFWLSYNERQICFFYLVIMDELLEFPKCYVIFCYEKKSTCFFIKPMNNSRPIFTLLTVKIFHLSNKLIDECSKTSYVTRCRMRINSGIFTHSEKIIIFKNNF